MPIAAVCLVLTLLMQMGSGGSGPGGSGKGNGSATMLRDNFLIAPIDRKPVAPPASAAFARLDADKLGVQSCVVRVFGLAEGTYNVVRQSFNGGFWLGTLDVAADGQGQLEAPAPVTGDFKSWFDQGDTIEVQHGGDVLFSDPLHSSFAWLPGPGSGSMTNGARLIAVGADLAARGRVLYTEAPNHRSFFLRLERLVPGPYILEVAGKPALWVDTGPGGNANLSLDTRLSLGTGVVTVDTAGQLVRVLDAAGAVVLAAQMPADPDSHLHRTAAHQKFGDAGDGAADGLSVDFIKSGFSYFGNVKQGRLTWRRDALGAATLTVAMQGDLVTSYPYQLTVDGAWIADLQVPSGASKLPFEQTLDVAPDLDLRGRRVEVRDEDFGTAPLSLYFPQSVPAGLRAYRKDLRSSHHLRLDLLNPGTDLDATGQLDWRKHKGVEQLQLDVQDLPAGSYDVVIDGVVVAAGALVVSEDGDSAEQLFSTDGVLPGSVPLEFAVTGALEIRAAGTSNVFLLQDLGS
jgi:hypothetical protein